MNESKSENLKRLASKLEATPGVECARVWDKVKGKERIYLDVMKASGRKTEQVVVHQDGEIEGWGRDPYQDIDAGRYVSEPRASVLNAVREHFKN